MFLLSLKTTLSRESFIFPHPPEDERKKEKKVAGYPGRENGAPLAENTVC